MNELELLDQWVSQMSVADVKNLTEEEVLDKILERPGHPGQYGFMFPTSMGEDFAIIVCALIKRMGQIQNLKEKMKGRTRCV